MHCVAYHTHWSSCVRPSILGYRIADQDTVSTTLPILCSTYLDYQEIPRLQTIHMDTPTAISAQMFQYNLSRRAWMINKITIELYCHLHCVSSCCIYQIVCSSVFRFPGPSTITALHANNVSQFGINSINNLACYKKRNLLTQQPRNHIRRGAMTALCSQCSGIRSRWSHAD